MTTVAEAVMEGNRKGIHYTFFAKYIERAFLLGVRGEIDGRYFAVAIDPRRLTNDDILIEQLLVINKKLTEKEPE